MKGIEKDLLNVSVDALKSAYEAISNLKCDFATEIVSGGKSDTYGLDFTPEEAIKHTVQGYDADIVLVTEETGKNYSGEVGLEPTQTVLICDPTDRSIKMRQFLLALMQKEPGYSNKLVHQAFSEKLDAWENGIEYVGDDKKKSKLYMGPGSPSITGASASITVIRDRKIMLNVMINYVTGELFIADPLKPRMGSFEDYKKDKMRHIKFPSEGGKDNKFVAFLKKKGYSENLKQCNLGLKEEDDIDPWAGGPLRILRLSSFSYTDNDNSVSFILSNGEKICEWLGWLSWVKYASDPVESDEHALEAYRMFFENPRTRSLVSVAPAPHYSIFTIKEGETRVNLDRMFQLDDPSHYRETILVAPRHNIASVSRVKALGGHQEELKL